MTEPAIKFIARYLSAWSSDRLYRVYLVGDQMYFIRIGGQGGMGQAVGAQFGLAGMLVQQGIAKRGEAKRKSKLAEMDSHHPSELLSSHKHNFQCSGRDVVGSKLEPPSRFAWHGPHFGKWLLGVADRKPMTFQFEALEEMQEAYRQLPAILGARLEVNTKWDPIKSRFVKQ